LAYGSGAYGSVEYGGSIPSGAKVISLPGQYTVITTPTPITKSGAYRIVTTGSITKPGQYAIASSHTVTKSGQYTVSTKTIIEKSAQYAILTAPTPITKSGRYAIDIPYIISKSGQYAVITTTIITKSGQYILRPIILLPGQYAVITTPTPITKSGRYTIGVQESITKSGQYAIGKQTIITKNAQYAIQSVRPPITKPGMYVVMPLISDDEDYSKGVVTAGYVANDQVLWNGHSASANEITPSLDISSAGSLQVYIQTDSATTIYIQILTADGWVNYPTGSSLTFSGSGFAFYPIWFLTFTQVRFQTTAAAKLTIECFIRT
jgi:hypothetical protein